MGAFDRVVKSVVAEVESHQGREPVLLAFFKPEDGGETIRVGENVVLNRGALGKLFLVEDAVIGRFGDSPLTVRGICAQEFRGMDSIDNTGKLTRFKMGAVLRSESCDSITLAEIAEFEAQEMATASA